MLRILALCGMLFTGGLGEENPAYFCVARVEPAHWRVEVEGSTSNKFTGAGWDAYGAMDRRLGRLAIGVSTRYREAGVWAKHKISARAGYDLGPTWGELLYEHELWQRPYSNRVQSWEWRQWYGSRVEQRVTTYYHRSTVSAERGWGAKLQLGVRVF